MRHIILSLVYSTVPIGAGHQSRPPRVSTLLETHVAGRLGLAEAEVRTNRNDPGTDFEFSMFSIWKLAPAKCAAHTRGPMEDHDKWG